MLESLLRLIAAGGIQSYEDAARRLSVAPPLIEVMLEELTRLGYLRAVGRPGGASEPGADLDPACGIHCSLDATTGGQCRGCHAGGCLAASSGRVWTLTAKGARTAARL